MRGLETFHLLLALGARCGVHQLVAVLLEHPGDGPHRDPPALEAFQLRPDLGRTHGGIALLVLEDRGLFVGAETLSRIYGGALRYGGLEGHRLFRRGIRQRGLRHGAVCPRGLHPVAQALGSASDLSGHIDALHAGRHQQQGVLPDLRGEPPARFTGEIRTGRRDLLRRGRSAGGRLIGLRHGRLHGRLPPARSGRPGPQPACAFTGVKSGTICGATTGRSRPCATLHRQTCPL